MLENLSRLSENLFSFQKERWTNRKSSKKAGATDFYQMRVVKIVGNISKRANALIFFGNNDVAFLTDSAIVE